MSKDAVDTLSIWIGSRGLDPYEIEDEKWSHTIASAADLLGVDSSDLPLCRAECISYLKGVRSACTRRFTRALLESDDAYKSEGIGSAEKILCEFIESESSEHYRNMARDQIAGIRKLR